MIAILSIGTELTTGQILNKNAQWLSIELLKLGMTVSYQITAPDDADLVKKALNFLEDNALKNNAQENNSLEKNPSIVFVTGGLGPTADDFTRTILADNYGLPMVWNEENWVKVKGKLTSKGVQIRDLHRQQCEFPKGAEILANNAGVADGFTLITVKGIEIYALPGPPKELAAIWEDHIRLRLFNRTPEPLRWIQAIWTVFGLPESEVAAKVNDSLGEAGNGVLYRVHSPCVDVKLLYQQKDALLNEKLGQQIGITLAPWLVVSDI